MPFQRRNSPEENWDYQEMTPIVRNPRNENWSTEIGTPSFRNRCYAMNSPSIKKPAGAKKLLRKSKSMVWSKKYPKGTPEVEDAEPLDSISVEHIYAEIEEYKDTPDTPPVIPPRADTPIDTRAPDYPPYSSAQALKKHQRKISLNIDGGIPRFDHRK